MDVFLQKFLIKLSMLNILHLLHILICWFYISNGLAIHQFTYIPHLNNEENSTAKPLGKQEITVLTLVKMTEEGFYFVHSSNTNNHFIQEQCNNFVTFSLFFF